MDLRTRIISRCLRFAPWLVGTSLLFGGCDPTLRATAENGIINLSQALLTSFLSAITQLIQESAAASA